MIIGEERKSYMTNNAIAEAIRLYKEARQFHTRTKAARATKPIGAWLEIAEDNRSKALDLLERVIALGENDEALRRHEVYRLAHRNLGLLRADRLAPVRIGQRAAGGGVAAYALPSQHLFGQPHSNEQAITHLTTALNLGLEKDGAVCRTLGIAYCGLGRFEEAVEVLREAVDFNEQDAKARSWLCMAYLSLGKRDTAREEYGILQQSAPSLAKRLEPVIEGAVL